MSLKTLITFSAGKSVIEAFDWLIYWGVIAQTLFFAASAIITLWMLVKGVEERNIRITYWINFFFFLVNMARAAIDPFWTMNYVPAVLGAFLYGNPNNFVIGNLFWFAFIFLELVGKGNLSERTQKVAKYLIFGQTFLVLAGEIICLALVGAELHELAWRFFPLWAGSILIIPMFFYSVCPRLLVLVPIDGSRSNRSLAPTDRVVSAVPLDYEDHWHG